MSQATFQVGDFVWVPLAFGKAIGKVVEDRGRLGVGGRRLLRVVVPNGPYVPSDQVVPEVELQKVRDEDTKELRDHFSTNAIVDFLIHGGLLAILQAESSEPVWLMRDSQGNLTYTYLPGFSATGGQLAPRIALCGESIFTPRRPEVVEFVKSFGVSAAEAERVVDAVGTAP